MSHIQNLTNHPIPNLMLNLNRFTFQVSKYSNFSLVTLTIPNSTYQQKIKVSQNMKGHFSETAFHGVHFGNNLNE
jgi:hypothetical protein